MVNHDREKKDFQIYVIDADDEKQEVTALANVMGVRDSYGDVVFNGAYVKTISERIGKVKILNNHSTASVLDAVAKLISLREISRNELPSQVLMDYPEATGALEVVMKFFDDPTKISNGIYARIKHGVINSYSIGYEEVKSDVSRGIDREGKPILTRNLRELKLWEISPVLFPANEASITTGVKTDSELTADDATPPTADALASEFPHLDATFAELKDKMADFLSGLDADFLSELETETKAGRVLSQANVARAEATLADIDSASGKLREILQAAGVSDTLNTSDEVDSKSTHEAEPPQALTSKDAAQLLAELNLLELDLMEVTNYGQRPDDGRSSDGGEGA